MSICVYTFISGTENNAKRNLMNLGKSFSLSAGVREAHSLQLFDNNKDLALRFRRNLSNV